MITRNLMVENELGIHARIAGRLVRRAQGFQCRIEIVKNGRCYNPKSVMDLMLACCKKGESIQFTFDGPDEDAAAAAMEQEFAERFGE